MLVLFTMAEFDGRVAGEERRLCERHRAGCDKMEAVGRRIGCAGLKDNVRMDEVIDLVAREPPLMTLDILEGLKGAVAVD